MMQEEKIISWYASNFGCMNRILLLDQILWIQHVILYIFVTLWLLLRDQCKYKLYYCVMKHLIMTGVVPFRKHIRAIHTQVFE